MADATVTRLGQADLTGATDALFLKKWSGEILTAFEQATVMSGRMVTKSIQGGKSATFPVVGTATAHYHTVGTEITGKTIPQNEVVVTLDPILIADTFVADIDEAMNYYDARSIFTKEMAQTLATTRDRNVIIELIKGARASAIITGGTGGEAIVDDKFKINATSGSADVKAQAQALASGFFDAAKILTQKNIPLDNAYCLLRPAEYFALVRNPDVIQSNWGGSSAYYDGKVWRIAGIEIVMTNSLPSTNTTQTSDSMYNAYHSVDASKTIGLITVPQAVAQVNLIDLFLQVNYDPRRLGTLAVAGYSSGTKFLRPECIVEMKLNTLSN